MATEGHILIVDDEPLSREVLARRLESHGFRAERCCDGASCLSTIEQDPPDVLLLDIHMPGLSGLQVLTGVRRRWTKQQLPVILVTALSDSDDVIAGLAGGANDFVVKPFNLQVLIARMRVCLDAKRSLLEREKLEERLRTEKDLLEERIRERTADLARSNQLLTAEVAQRRESEESLLAHREKLRELAAQVALAEEQERRRIAGGLHDDIGQTLALADLKLGSVIDSTASETRATLEEVRQLLSRAIKTVRTLTFDLGARVLYQFGLETAIENLAERLEQDHGIPTAFQDDALPKPLEEDVKVALFQAVREVLHNVVKHAGARHVTVAIRRAEEEIEIAVRDDGVGFDASRLETEPLHLRGYGLFNIRERLGYIGGRLLVRSTPGDGTEILLTTPLTGYGPRRPSRAAV